MCRLWLLLVDDVEVYRKEIFDKISNLELNYLRYLERYVDELHMNQEYDRTYGCNSCNL